MTIIRTAAIAAVAMAATLGAMAPAEARPPHRGHHQVCHMERHHGHAVRVCHRR